MKLNKTLLIAALSLLAATGLMAKHQTKDEIPGVAAQPASYFYTGKPYDADLGNYVFASRNYDPSMSRWTSNDPSGFPDGANNNVYAPVPTFALDVFGLEAYKYVSANVIETWTVDFQTSSLHSCNFTKLYIGDAPLGPGCAASSFDWSNLKFIRALWSFTNSEPGLKISGDNVKGLTFIKNKDIVDGILSSSLVSSSGNTSIDSVKWNFSYTMVFE